MRPLPAAIDVTMCCTQAKSPLLSVGSPAKARPQGSFSQTSRPHCFSEKGGLAITQSKVGQPTGAGVGKDRVAQRVAALDDEILDAVQQQVHARDGGGGQVLLLAVELAEEGARVAALVAHVRHGGKQHAARAAGRVVDGLALLRVEDVRPSVAPRCAGCRIHRPCYWWRRRNCLIRYS